MLIGALQSDWIVWGLFSEKNQYRGHKLRIKKLELVGFKSFKDRTVIHFDAGITGIVGPNGCGKSNIVDALVWVMGEQSAKHLRGASMEDVIFGGAEGYSPSGMAEVSLTLENDGGPFPAKYAKFSEVMVTRRLHRSGESEYLINKEPSRLRDIQEIFMDTGAGSKGFSIIEQGAIGKIITSKPEDRRVLIEEAAGITKFKARKKESQRKLVATDQNLVRLADIVGELKRQLESLQRQAKRAERYRELKNQAESLDLWITSKKFAELKAIGDEADQKFQASQTQEVGGRAELEQMEAGVQTLRLAVLELEKAVEETQTQHFSVKNQVSQTESEVQTLKFEVESARRQAQLQGDMKQEYEARQQILVRELEQVSQHLSAVSEKAESLRVESESKTAEYQRVQSRITEIDTELTTHRREHVAVSQTEGMIREKVVSLEAKLEEVQRREESATAVLEELNEKKAPFEERRNKVFAQLEKERQMQLDIMSDVETFEANLRSVESQVVEKRAEVDTFKDEFNQVASRLYGLENLNANFEGFEEGVKNVMLWQKSRKEMTVDGSVVELAPVADVVEVPAEYELAMEAALGTKLQVLLSSSSDGSLEAVEYLKQNNAGRSSFYMSDMAGGVGASTPQGEGVKAILKDVVRAGEQFQSSVNQLLGRVVVVDSIRSALRLRPEHPGWTFVTQEGDVLDHEGILTGGTSESADSGMLKRRREIKELSQKKEEWAGKLALAQGALKKLEASYETLKKELDNAHRAKTEKEILVTELKKDLERAEVELQNLVKAFERQQNEVNQIAMQRSSQEDALADVQEKLIEVREKKLELDNKVTNLTQELDSSKTGIDELRESATRLQVESASKRQEMEGLTREKERISFSLGQINEQLSKMGEESSKTVEVMSLNQLKLEESKVMLEKLIAQAEETEKHLSLAKEKYEVQSEELREIEDKINDYRRTQNQLQMTMNEAKLQLEQARLKEDYLVTQIRERYMLDLPQIYQEHMNREGDLVAAEVELTDCRDKLKKIGEVNLSAIEEYDEIAKRYEFLSQQQNDLIEAKEQLRKVIDRINRICSKRFRETFDAVNERYQKVFPVLFGGGEAKLILIESEDGDEGIDMIARPPGKKLQSVTLLSGGEKALSSVALIFSIFLVKPSPFCLLDEVDAPLDDANVARFNDLVREMAKRSQIIVVTHNKYTMEINEKLYGVTMQEKGVSKMVSVSLTDARSVVNA